MSEFSYEFCDAVQPLSGRRCVKRKGHEGDHSKPGEKPDTELPGDWARDIAATYRKIAEESGYPLARAMNFHEAAKYEGLASRMDAAT